MRTLRMVFTAGAALCLTMGAVATGAGAAAAAGTRPAFDLPFPCGQTWHGNSSNSSSHRSYEIDFNRGGSANADLGDTVVAAAGGTVLTSAHQGSANGYGNLIVIDHGGGWRTYYGHLRVRSVAKGAVVSQGEKIGEVGNTTKPGNSVSAHLHYEVRTTGTSYPASIQRASFNGAQFGYPDQSVMSHNSCDGGSNRYFPTEVCGDGSTVVDQETLGDSGVVYLLFSGSARNNCVVTLKSTSVGIASDVSAYLEAQGGSRITDSGSYSYYAGPVRAPAAGLCVKWGGSVGGATYDSPFEHCG